MHAIYCLNYFLNLFCDLFYFILKKNILVSKNKIINLVLFSKIKRFCRIGISIKNFSVNPEKNI